MIEKWGRLNSWPGPLSPGDLLELPDVAAAFNCQAQEGEQTKVKERAKAKDQSEIWQEGIQGRPKTRPHDY